MRKLIFISALLLFCRPFMAFPQSPVEKIYIQTDRNHYVAGETIYFKGYVLSDIDTIESSNLFVELWDDTIQKLGGLMLPVMAGSAAGSITIPKELKSNRVFLRAFTDVSSSYQNPFQFVKPVLDARDFGLLPVTDHSDSGVPLFFPEGGKMVFNALNYVAFRTPGNFNAVIRNNKGETVTTVNSVFNGMGVFSLTPVTGESYSCYWKKNGKEFVLPLPMPVENSVSLHVRQSADSLYFDLDKGGSNVPRLQKLKVQLVISNEVAYLVELNMKAMSKFSYFIPLAEFHTGMAELRLLDEEDMLLASRNLFIKRHSLVAGNEIVTIIKDLRKRGENRIRLQLKDTALRYVSVSITDVEYDESAHVSGLIDTYISETGKPALYMPDQITNPEQLDLFIQTSAATAPVKSTGMNRIRPVTGKNLQLHGTVKKGRKWLAGKEVMVGIRSAYTGKELYKVRTDEKGEFVLDGLILYDEVFVHCRLPGRGADELSCELTLKQPAANDDADFFATFKKMTGNILPVRGDTFPVRVSVTGNTVPDDTLVFSERAITLDEVVLNSGNRQASWKRMAEMEKKYVDGGPFSGYYASGELLDVMNDPLTQNYVDLFSYLGANLRSVTMRIIKGEKQLICYGRGSTGETMVTTFYLGNLKLDRNMLNSISLNEVAMVKFVPMLGSERGFPAALAIYLKKPGEQGYWEKDRYQLQEKKCNGYVVPREIIMPDYSDPATQIEKDTRKTLFWNPFTALDKGIAEIRFFNNDRTKKIRIVVAGIAEDGSIVLFEKEVE